MISGHWPTQRQCLIAVTVWYLDTDPHKDSVWLVLQYDIWALSHKETVSDWCNSMISGHWPTKRLSDCCYSIISGHWPTQRVSDWCNSMIYGHWQKKRQCLVGVTVWYLDTGPKRDSVWLLFQYDIWTLAHTKTVPDLCYSMISGHWPTQRQCLIGVTLWYLDTDPHKDSAWLMLQYDIWALAQKETVSDCCNSMISGHWPKKIQCLIAVTVWYLDTDPHKDSAWFMLQYDIWALTHTKTVPDWCYIMISGHWPTQRQCLICVIVWYLDTDQHKDSA